MSCFQIHQRRDATFESVFPPSNADAPFISGFEARKTPLRARRYQIVPVEYRKIKKLAGSLNTYRVQADIIRPGAAITIAIKTSKRIAATAF